MPTREDYPVTAATIEAAKVARDAERRAAGITCDSEGRILHPVRKTA